MASRITFPYQLTYITVSPHLYLTPWQILGMTINKIPPSHLHGLHGFPDIILTTFQARLLSSTESYSLRPSIPAFASSTTIPLLLELLGYGADRLAWADRFGNGQTAIQHNTASTASLRFCLAVMEELFPWDLRISRWIHCIGENFTSAQTPSGSS